MRRPAMVSRRPREEAGPEAEVAHRATTCKASWLSCSFVIGTIQIFHTDYQHRLMLPSAADKVHPHHKPGLPAVLNTKPVQK